jgi:hypothetical protein
MTTNASIDFVPTLFELRRYRAEPGRLATLTGMFEALFLDAYQAGGTRIIATFHELDVPDRWVWIRAFPDAASRGERLQRFYGGAVWKRNATACNATIADIDEALLLRELDPGALRSIEAAPIGSDMPDAIYGVIVSPLGADAQAAADGAAARFAGAELGGRVVATLVSDAQENSFPRQAVRKDPVVVAIHRFEALEEARAWRDAVHGPATAMLLAPGARSGLR